MTRQLGWVCLLATAAHAVVPIGELHRNDGEGYPLPPWHIGAPVEIAGIVTVPTGTFSRIRTEIYVQDETGGILVYRSDRIFTVALGDSVVVQGVIGQYRGTTQVVPEVVTVVGTGRLPEPRPTTCGAIAASFLEDWTEPDESRLVRVTGATYDAASGTLTDGTGSCELSLDPDTGITLPSGTYDLQGVIRQWDSTPPYTESYQLVPRFVTDVQEAQGPRFVGVPFESDFAPDGFTVHWETDTEAAGCVRWGVHVPGEGGSIVDSTWSLTHAVRVQGLSPATIYVLQVIAWNDEGSRPSPVWAASTGSAPGCTGTITAYFTQSIAPEYATEDVANGNALLVRRLLDRINAARSSIDACLYDLTVPEVTTALISAKNRGVRVRVITEAQNWGSEVQALVAAGIPVLTDTAGPNDGAGYMHHKFLVFDFADRSSSADDYVWTGSANVTYNGLSQNAENVLVIQDQAVAGAFTAEFEEMWGGTGPSPSPQTARFGTRKRGNTPHRFSVGGVPVEVYMSPSDGCASRLKEGQHPAPFQRRRSPGRGLHEPLGRVCLEADGEDRRRRPGVVLLDLRVHQRRDRGGLPTGARPRGADRGCVRCGPGGRVEPLLAHERPGSRRVESPGRRAPPGCLSFHAPQVPHRGRRQPRLGRRGGHRELQLVVVRGAHER